MQRELGNTTEAEAYFMEVLKHREALLGSDHPDLMVPLSNMGGIALDKGQYDASIQYYTIYPIKGRIISSDSRQ